MQITGTGLFEHPHVSRTSCARVKPQRKEPAGKSQQHVSVGDFAFAVRDSSMCGRGLEYAKHAQLHVQKTHSRTRVHAQLYARTKKLKQRSVP
jgi:hypothetical protein